MIKLPTIIELADALAAFQKRIESFSVRYEQESTWDAAVAEAGLLNDHTTSGSWRFAFKGEKRYRKYKSLGFGPTGELMRSTGEIAYDGFETLTRMGKKKIQVRRGKPNVSGNAISSSIGWPTTDWDREQIEQDPARAVFFPSILRTGSWIISQARVSHIERSVLLVENENNQIRAWFDIDLGPCLVQLEVENPWPGVQRQSRILDDFERFEAFQIGLPRHITQETALIDSKGRAIGVRNSTVIVNEYTVNDVDDALFSFPITERDRAFRDAG